MFPGCEKKEQNYVEDLVWFPTMIENISGLFLSRFREEISNPCHRCSVNPNNNQTKLWSFMKKYFIWQKMILVFMEKKIHDYVEDIVWIPSMIKQRFDFSWKNIWFYRKVSLSNVYCEKKKYDDVEDVVSTIIQGNTDDSQKNILIWQKVNLIPSQKKKRDDIEDVVWIPTTIKQLKNRRVRTKQKLRQITELWSNRCPTPEDCGILSRQKITWNWRQSV